MAETAKAVLLGQNIESIIIGDNLAITGGPEFGINYVQLAVINDGDFQKAEEALNDNGFN